MPRVVNGNKVEILKSISFEALLVNVTASIFPGDTCWLAISQAILVVSTLVLPDPAPARIKDDVWGSLTAFSCWLLRFSKIEDIF